MVFFKRIVFDYYFTDILFLKYQKFFIIAGFVLYGLMVGKFRYEILAHDLSISLSPAFFLTRDVLMTFFYCKI